MYQHHDMRMTRRQFLLGTSALGALMILPSSHGWATPSRIPVLLYHDISRFYGDNLTVEPVAFALQMETLSSLGYRAVSLHDALSAVGEKIVVITFDGGFASFCDYVLPLLQQYSFHATINVIGKYVGKVMSSNGNRPMLSWDEYRELTSSGFVTVGCRIPAHYPLVPRDVSGVGYDEFREDMVLFKQIVSRELGTPADILACAYDRRDRRCMAVTEEGFSYVLTSTPGQWDISRGTLEIPRLTIERKMNIASFLQSIGENI